MRLLHLLVIAALVVAASYVYHIKFDSTQRAERVAKQRSEIRRERESIAALRAEWAKLENPARLQGLAVRHLPLKPIDPAQFDPLDKLPERPPSLVPPDSTDPIGALIDISESDFTASVPSATNR
jgi:cell division protein FtsL